jgi:hypothetical protein
LARLAGYGDVDRFRRFERWKLSRTTVATLHSRVQEIFLLVFMCSLAAGCHSRSSRSGPSIEFTRIPQAADGGPDKLDIIEGQVIGGVPGQKIVLYAKSGAWWVQPLVSEAFTKIQDNSKWINSTHLGTEYAAMLVEADYHPPVTMSELPTPGGGVVDVATAQGAAPGSGVSKMLSFSGYEWRIRDTPSDRGGMNFYDSNNAWTDSNGALHLRIAKEADHWTCAEVTLARSLGYGTYSFVVRNTAKLEPPAVFSMFTWDWGGTDQYHREMDIEISRWGDPTSKNGQYVVQPFFIPENASRYAAPSGVLTHYFRWEPGQVSFKTVRGSGNGSKPAVVAEHVFTSGVPSSGVETVRMNLYVFRGAKESLQDGAEVVIEKFEFLP